MRYRAFHHLLLGFAATVLAACPALAGEVAVTFDDLPVYGDQRPVEVGEKLTRKLLAGLVRHHIPAIGFVNESQLDRSDKPARTALLERWLDAGMDLGNHSYSHMSLSHTPLDTYIADVERGEVVTKRLLAARGKQETWYRYPYLETGQTPEIHRAFDAWLAAHGYRVAPVTMENSDWEFADAYDHANKAGDRKRAREAKAAYLLYTRQAVAWYREASVALLGREIRFVLLLHASQLNADTIDAIAAILRRAHLKPVTLARAVEDPAYTLPDTADDANGDEWLTRWSLALHKSLPYGDLPAVPKSIAGDTPP